MTDSPRESELDLGVKDIVTSLRSITIDPQHTSTSADPESLASTTPTPTSVHTDPARPAIKGSPKFTIWHRALDELLESAEIGMPCKGVESGTIHVPGKGGKMAKLRHQARAREKALGRKGKKLKSDRRQKKRRRARRADETWAEGDSEMKGLSGAMEADVEYDER
ncbi:hypothetical protein LIA77_12000 [Sarocladium implicatum]|nr:hypothetical protein LIA77_12000 [Sarocladium implicatum]